MPAPLELRQAAGVWFDLAHPCDDEGEGVADEGISSVEKT